MPRLCSATTLIALSLFIIRAVFLSRKLGDTPYQGSKEVGLIDRGLILDSRRRPLQPHSGIDIGLGQRSALALFILVILGEDQVPDFGKAPAGAVGTTVRLTAADILTEVIVDFAAGPAGTGVSGRPPEVVLLAASQYSLLRGRPPPASSRRTRRRRGKWLPTVVLRAASVFA